MVVFDTSVLLYLFQPNAKPPQDPQTGNAISDCAKRVDFLLKNLSADGEKIIIPTPALSEILVHSGDKMQKYLTVLNGQSVFRIANFDQKSAIETAQSVRMALRSGDKRSGAVDPLKTSYGKVKFDRQIVAIAKAEGAHTIYSADRDIKSHAHKAGLKCVGLHELDLPPADPQTSMAFDP